MRSRRYALPLRAKALGQSMVEYLLLAAIALALLATPYDGERSVVGFMLSSVRTAYAKFLAAMSIPQ